MEVKIITITGESNYGNILQNYAVKTILEKIGCNVETVKTEYEYGFGSTNMDHLKKILKIILKHGDYLRIIRERRFKSFSDEYLNKSLSVCMESSPKIESECDCLVFGSDQIWNFTWGGRLAWNINYFTGGFSQNIPKIAYSASIGADFIPKEYQSVFSENISKFKAISVREEKAVEIIKELTGIEALVTIDPTLMLDKSDWIKVAKKPKYIRNQEKFILTYFLGQETDEVHNLVEKLAKEKNLKIVNLNIETLPNEKIKNPDYFTTAPSEFIWLVANCEIMFTDSFHGSVFSILMSKPFRCFNRAEEGVESTMSRMDTLFDMFSIKEWCTGNADEDIEHLFFCEYSNVKSVLEEKRRFSVNYLRKELDTDAV